jgi:opacity protein-like surface antigen
MLIRFFALFVLCMAPVGLSAQSDHAASWQIYGGFTSLSNSFNGVPGARQPLLGWQGSVAFPAWHNLRGKLDFSTFRGTNLGAPQHAFAITGGGEYDRFIGKERIFGEALFGDMGLNGNWAANSGPGDSASFTTFFGGGLDTPVSKHFALRVEGGWQYTDFALFQSASYKYPYRIPGLPNNFARFSTGLVWTPRIRTLDRPRKHADPDSELVYESIDSFGHFRILANSWWSNLHLAGVEYDRHSWGHFAGARVDYSPDLLPVVVLNQPANTDVWGNVLSLNRENVPGLAVSPLGLRMIWRDGARVKPYFLMKGGLIFFTQKALSKDGSYGNLTLQESLGVQFKMTDRWDLRAGLEFFHFSDGFVVPSNPGLDSMTCNVGLSYHLGKRTARYSGSRNGVPRSPYPQVDASPSEWRP